MHQNLPQATEQNILRTTSLCIRIILNHPDEYLSFNLLPPKGYWFSQDMLSHDLSKFFLSAGHRKRHKIHFIKLHVHCGFIISLCSQRTCKLTPWRGLISSIHNSQEQLFLLDHLSEFNQTYNQWSHNRSSSKISSRSRAFFHFHSMMSIHNKSKFLSLMYWTILNSITSLLFANDHSFSQYLHREEDPGALISTLTFPYFS